MVYDGVGVAEVILPASVVFVVLATFSSSMGVLGGCYYSPQDATAFLSNKMTKEIHEKLESITITPVKIRYLGQLSFQNKLGNTFSLKVDFTSNMNTVILQHPQVQFPWLQRSTGWPLEMKF